MTYDQIRAEKNAIRPESLILPDHAEPEWPIPWYPGYDIMRNEEVWVPAHAVFHPVPRIMGKLFRTSTNGIASGNTYEEAVFHSLCELIERDAWSLVEASNHAGPVLLMLLSGCKNCLKSLSSRGRVICAIHQ
jgi:ribosomal protein S12 methylthiotransferase accessory factor